MANSRPALSESEIRRRVDKMWAVRTSGNKDAATRADALELALYRDVLKQAAHDELARRQRLYDAGEPVEERNGLLIEACGGLPSSRTWRP